MRAALKRTYQILFLLLFTVATVRAIMAMADQTIVAAIVCVPVLLLFFLVRPSRRSKRSVSYTKCWIAVQCASLVIMLAEMYVMEMKLSWDWRLLIETAYQYAMGLDVSGNLLYFAVYENNRFWLTCLIWFFRIAHKLCPAMTELRQYKQLSMLLGGAMTQLTILLVYQTARKLFDEKRAFLTGLFAAMFLPFYLYAQQAYTDVPCMFGTALVFFLYVKLKRDRKRRNLLLVLFGLTAGFIFKIKVLVAILLIAIVIEELLTARKAKELLTGLLISGIALVLAVSCANFITKKTVVISDELLERYEFPITHFVMMGLKGKGGYSDKEVQNTKKRETYEKRVEYNLRVIRKRLKKLGPVGLLEHIFGRKMRYTWGNSCLAGNDYGTRYPMRYTLLWELLSLRGKYHRILLIFTWPYYMLLLLGILFSTIAAFKEKATEFSIFDVGRLAILGIMLFLFIWECNGRYLLSTVPVMLPVAAQGIFQARAFLRRFSAKRAAQNIVRTV